MTNKTNRVLVLMRDASAETGQSFMADLYIHDRVEDSVYLNREALLEWSLQLGPQVSILVARGMNVLLCHPEQLMHTVSLG